jgi:hypothetical protein
VRSHQVDQHQRNGSNVSSPKGWQNPKETYKPWLTEEKEGVLSVLSVIPKQYQMENFYLYRAQSSDTKGNPASIHINSRSITLYDTFFKQKNKDAILVHESAHYHFSRLTESQREKFFELSGWKKIITNKGPKLHPPEKLIKEDSCISPEEDFSNYTEVYFESPQELKSLNTQLFQYFEERHRP